MAKVGPVKFAREVKMEAKKVTWPTRKETMITTIMVFIMVSIVAMFLFVADQVLATVIQAILGIGQ